MIIFLLLNLPDNFSKVFIFFGLKKNIIQIFDIKIFIFFQFIHGTIIPTGLTCKKIPLKKYIEYGMTLK